MNRQIAAVVCSIALAVSGCGQSDFMKERARQLREGRQPPPKPPECPPLPELANLQLPQGGLANVRIFRFEQTIIYVPVAWLELSDDVRDLDVGRYSPDVHASECPGVVHQVTDGGILGRFAGVSIDPDRRDENSARRLFLQKIRTAPHYALNDPRYTGFVPGTGLRSDYDAYVVVSDIGVRFSWRPVGISDLEWIGRADRFGSGQELGVNPLLKPDQKGAWGHLVGTAEWNTMELSIRRMMTWLATSPSQRDNAARFHIPTTPGL